MSATVLVSGRLHRDPERKTSKTGKPFVSASLREGDGEHVTWWSVLTFSETAIEELLTLKAGDGMAASGSFKAEIYTKGDAQRLSFTLFADRIISARKQRREKQGRQSPAPQSQSEMPDFDDGWTP